MQPESPVRLTPLVRVVDATLVEDGGVVAIVVSGLARSPEVADAVAKGGGVAELIGGRLRVVTLPSRLIDAVGRVGGAELAEPLRAVVDVAVAGWLDGPSTARIGPLALGPEPAVMGIVNVTPDSFSDGGAHASTAAAIEHGMALAAEGASILDVGGESTRPGASPVPLDEELDRVVPVVDALAAAGLVVSIDTTKAEVAKRCVAAGAAMVNDVSGGSLDHAMLTTVASLDVPYVAMHRRGTPMTMQDEAHYVDVTAEVFDEVAVIIRRALVAGIAASRLLVDPGVGFAKTTDHNLRLIRDLRQFRSFGFPVLVGASRKSFIGDVLHEKDPNDRMEGSLASAVAATLSRASIIRVHDVAETIRATRVAAAIVAGHGPVAGS